MNKKFDRVLQWGKEKMGNDQKTATTDTFKMMEQEMQLRHEGMEKLHSSAAIYIKSLSKRREGDDKEKMIPVDIVGQAMVTHGEEFEDDSQYGGCLISFGRAHESIARIQEAYVDNLNENWLLGLERNLAQMKEYQAARKKLESRRLAYDATLSKMQKQKKEDFRVEEELRSQKIKYEESSDDVERRMHDIQDAETETLADLGAFLDAELEYYNKCRNLLMRVKEQWPTEIPDRNTLKKTRSRSNTMRSYTSNGHGEREREREREVDYDDVPPPQPERPSIRSRGVSGSFNEKNDRRPELAPRPSWSRGNGEPLSRTSSYDSTSPAPTRMLRTVTDPMAPPLPRGGLRPIMTRTASQQSQNEDVFADDHNTSPEKPYGRFSDSPVANGPSRTNSSTSLASSTAGRKLAPPPPVQRIKKPPPPPPPIKRAGLSSLSIHDN